MEYTKVGVPILVYTQPVYIGEITLRKPAGSHGLGNSKWFATLPDGTESPPFTFNDDARKWLSNRKGGE